MANLPDFSNIQAPPMIKPWVQIIEQPAPKALRFRYECEGRSAGSIPGENSTPENRTYPTIQLNGYRGDAMVYVSCVTKDPPYRPHPHNLVGREGCREGVCKVKIPTETMCLSFQNLGIQCVKKKDVEKALRLREAKHMDPFKTGFSHCNQPTSIDLNAVRLCFHVLLKDQHGIYRRSLDPVVTQPIFDKKATSDLRIVKLSHCVCYADGGTTEIILLCEKVAKEDIEVRFFEEKDDLLLWEAVGDFQPAQVHKQTAIWFRPPPYQNVQIVESVKVFIQLRRPSDGCTSEPYDFEYIPVVHTGRPLYWSFRRSVSTKRQHNELLSCLLGNNIKSLHSEWNRNKAHQEIVVETNNNEVTKTETNKPVKRFNQAIELDDNFLNPNDSATSNPRNQSNGACTKIMVKSPLQSKRECDLEKVLLPAKRSKIEIQGNVNLPAKRPDQLSIKPCWTLPNPSQKKKGIFSKLFARKTTKTLNNTNLVTGKVGNNSNKNAKDLAQSLGLTEGDKFGLYAAMVAAEGVKD